MVRRLSLLVLLLLVCFLLSLRLGPWPGASPARAQSPTAGSAPAFSQPPGPATSANGHAHIQHRPDRPLPRAGTLGTASINNVSYNGGPIMQSPVTTYAIFWLGTSSGQHFQSDGNDAQYEGIVTSYFKDVFQSASGVNFYNILQQYGTPSPLASVSTSFGGSWVDTTNAYPHAGTVADPLFDTDIQAEVSRALSAKGWTPGLNAIFFVYTGLNVQSCIDSSRSDCTFVDYCAYHSAFTQGGRQVVYANMPDTPANCATGESPNGDSVADDVVNVSSHEQFESVTDPLGTAWWVSNLGSPAQGEEIGDLCAWNFGSPLGGASGAEYNQALNNSGKFYLQQEWSNASSGCALTYGTSASATAPGTFSVTVSGVTSTSAVVSWTTPSPGTTSSGSPATISTYYVVPLIGSTAGTPLTASASPQTVSGLTPSTTYTFAVVAINSAGLWSYAVSSPVTTP